MNISELVETSGWKNFIAKLYSIGAAIVITGAMFKIMHWPGASMMLIIGLSTEAVIFFFSAFEPVHEELDWTLVYPELAGMNDPEDMEQIREEEVNSRGVDALEKFEDIVQNSNLNVETFTKLGAGIEQFNNTVRNISDISETVSASKEYMANVKNAASAVSNLTVSYGETSEALKSSIGSLANSYKSTAEIIEHSGAAISEQVNKSGEYIVNSYQKLSESVGSYYNAISEGGKTYGEQLSSLNNKLTMLNELYELQHNTTKSKLQETEQLFSGFSEMNKDLTSSVEETKKYREELSKLGTNLAALNNIYGNMLSAMNFNKNI